MRSEIRGYSWHVLQQEKEETMTYATLTERDSRVFFLGVVQMERALFGLIIA